MRARPHVVRVRVLRLAVSSDSVSQEVSGARNESCAFGRTNAVDSSVRGTVSPHHGGVVPVSCIPHTGSAPCLLTRCLRAPRHHRRARRRRRGSRDTPSQVPLAWRSRVAPTIGSPRQRDTTLAALRPARVARAETWSRATAPRSPRNRRRRSSARTCRPARRRCA